MTTLGQAYRVGLVVVIAIVLMIWGYMALTGVVDNRHTYALDVLFADASGADKDTPVTLAGVTIGKVKRVRLTGGQQADLTLEIQDEIENRRFSIPMGSTFSIVTPILGSTGTVVVTPPRNAVSQPPIPPGAANLLGESAPDLNTAFAKANVVLTQLAETTRRSDKLIDALTKTAISANTAIGGPEVQRALANLDRASDNGARLTAQLNQALINDNHEVQALLRQTGRGTGTALANIDATTLQFRALAAQNRGKLDDITANLQDTTASLSGITGQINEALKEGNAPKNLSVIIGNLTAASNNLVLISNNFEKLSSDQGLQGDLRATLQNVRASTEQTTYLLRRLNQIAGTKEGPEAVGIGTVGAASNRLPPGGTPPKTIGSTLTGPTLLPRLDLLQELRAAHFRSDLDTVIPIRGTLPGAFVRAGIYGLGDSNLGILEGGAALDPNGLYDYRVGLYASKLAVGADIGLGRRETLSLDAWDPNRLHLDARGDLQLGDGFGLLLGYEDILRDSDPTIGLEYRR